MRLVTFAFKDSDGASRVGVALGDEILDLAEALDHPEIAGRGALPTVTSIKAILTQGPAALEGIRNIVAETAKNPDSFRPPAGRLLRPRAEVRLLPPIPDPDKFLCVGKNYRTHLEELKANDLLAEWPDEPTAFVKLNSTLVGQDASVARPAGITSLDYEPEMAFVIGRPAYQVKRADAMGFVAGVTLVNDLTAREIQKREVKSGTRFWTAKNMPGFCPIGPSLITLDEIDPYALSLICRVNGELRMRVSTADQIFKIPDIIEHFSRYIPLQPGDVFSTGAPGGVAVGKPNPQDFYLKPGDTVEVGFENVATLRTRIVAP